jgi:hypothetical protein
MELPAWEGWHSAAGRARGRQGGGCWFDRDLACMTLLNLVGMEHFERPFCPTVLSILGVLSALNQLNYILACAPILFLQEL